LNDDSGWSVSDAAAFPESTTTVPEVRIQRLQPGPSPTTIRIRWYKLTAQWTPSRWMAALAQRDPAPVAIIGGGTSDRAKDLADALNREARLRTTPLPLLFLTTATATGLQQVYRDRTFRFCFNNDQMAAAVLQFATDRQRQQQDRFLALAGSAAVSAQPIRRVGLVWQDDPFSRDLAEQFSRHSAPITIDWLRIPYSVGGWQYPNQAEAEAVQSLLKILRGEPSARWQLILPTVTQPARRVLRALVDQEPGLSSRCVVLAGDGVPVNGFLRDGDVVWPYRSLPMTYLCFTHNDPFAGPISQELTRLTSTDDVLQFRTLCDTVLQAVNRLLEQGNSVTAESLRQALREPGQPFDPEGDWMGPEAHVVALERTPEGGTRIRAARRREGSRTWKLVHELQEIAPFRFQPGDGP